MLWPHFIRDFTMVSVGQDVKENRTVKKGVLFGEFGYFLHNEHVLAIALNSFLAFSLPGITGSRAW